MLLCLQRLDSQRLDSGSPGALRAAPRLVKTHSRQNTKHAVYHTHRLLDSYSYVGTYGHIIPLLRANVGKIDSRVNH